jgi:DNA ligase-1
MLKLKRFTDGEAKIVGMEEEQHNGNTAKTNALGHTERSGHKAGMVGKSRMGALIVKDLVSGVEFNIGTGFTMADRELFWSAKQRVLGMVVKYKSFLIGVKDAPRFPVYLGMRNSWDM